MNADSIIGTSEQSTGYNLYSYVENNSINAVDYDGQSGGGIAVVLGIELEKVLAGILAFGGGLLAYKIAKAAPTIYEIIATNPPSMPDRKPKDRKDDAIYAVYGLYKDDSEEPSYIGRTNNLARRASEHKRDVIRKDLTLNPIKENLTYAEARGLEQSLIMGYDTIEHGLNKINGVSKRNPKCLEYMLAAARYKEFYVGELKWCD